MSQTIAAPLTFTRVPRVAPVATGRSRGSVRLTRRGRLVVTLLFMAVLLAGFTAVAGQVVASGAAGEPLPTTTVVVGEGDTLWGIAAEIAEPGETRSMISEIVRLNSLAGVTIHAGQELAVPAP